MEESASKQSNIVKNSSSAYGYNYASLSDIAKAGIKIPKMRTNASGDYIEWYDEDTKEWIQGAKIVVPALKGMNTAQVYGSALTYARRYTTQMAMSVACDDDKKIEAKAPQQGAKPIDFNAVSKKCSEIDSIERLQDYAKAVSKFIKTRQDQDRVNAIIKARRLELEKDNQPEVESKGEELQEE